MRAAITGWEGAVDREGKEKKLWEKVRMSAKWEEPKSISNRLIARPKESSE